MLIQVAGRKASEGVLGRLAVVDAQLLWLGRYSLGLSFVKGRNGLREGGGIRSRQHKKKGGLMTRYRV